MLTSAEKKLYSVLLNRRDWELRHTTSAKLANTILSTEKPALLDSAETTRRGLSVQTATPEFCGINNNLFFGFGTTVSSLPIFTRARTNEETGEQEDYTTFIINYSAMSEGNSKLLTGLWCSGHMHAYQTAEDEADEKTIPPIQLGSSTFYWAYKIENVFHQKKYIKYFHYEREDKTKIVQRVDIDAEIAYEKDFLPFFVLSFIERLRYIGGTIRSKIMEDIDSVESKFLVNLLIETFFRVDNFELHLPTKMEIDNPYVKAITPDIRKEMTKNVSDAAAYGDINEMEILLIQGYPFEGYMYEDKYILDEEPLIFQK